MSISSPVAGLRPLRGPVAGLLTTRILATFGIVNWPGPFFANALRWLIRDPELSRAKIVVDLPDAAAGIEPGTEVPLEVRTFNGFDSRAPGRIRGARMLVAARTPTAA